MVQGQPTVTLNINKTVLLKFWPNEPFVLKVGDITLENSPNTKFLGVIVDDCLSWKDHCHYLYSKLNANRCLIARSKHLLPFLCLCNIYMAHFYSHMPCEIIVWGPMDLKSSQNSLYRLQKSCLRNMHGKKNSCDINQHLRTVNLFDSLI